jgi:hypothetical protein
MTHPSTNNYFFPDGSLPHLGKRSDETTQERSFWRATGPSEDYSTRFQESEPARKRARLISNEEMEESENHNMKPMILEITNYPSGNMIPEHGKSISNEDESLKVERRPTDFEYAQSTLFNRLVLQRISSPYCDRPVVDYVDAKLQDLIRGSLRTAIAMKKHCDAGMEDSDNQNGHIPSCTMKSEDVCMDYY